MMLTEFFDFEGCAAVRLYYDNQNKSTGANIDVKNILKDYGPYNITGTSNYEAFSPMFMTGRVEIAFIHETYTDIPFERITL
jgi:hypothetical protein